MYREIVQWRQIRRRVLEDGTSKKQVARETGISRRTLNRILTYEGPPGYGPRPSYYPKLGPYIAAIERLLTEAASSAPASRMTVRDIVDDLRRDEGFAGSYDSVRNYIRSRARDDESAWEQAYDLIISLPKTRAIDFIRLLSHGDTPIGISARVRPFVREAAGPRKSSVRLDREKRSSADIEWMRQVLQKEVGDVELYREFADVSDLGILLRHLRNGRLLHRNRAMVVLASRRKTPIRTICAFLGVSKTFVRKCRDKFDSNGPGGLFAPQSKSNRKIDNESLRNAVFSLLHEPPSNHGINRTTWTMPLMCHVLKNGGHEIGPALVAKMIRAAGYKWRKAKVVLTSNDPTYREKCRIVAFTERSDLLFFAAYVRASPWRSAWVIFRRPSGIVGCGMSLLSV
jgi:transposase